MSADLAMVSGKMLLLAGATALLPLVGGQAVGQPSESTGPAFTPPESPLVLTRTIWRTLADGKEIVVRRRYAVRFIRHGDGFRLDGQFLDAAVEAPPMLAAMAELERVRVEQDLFPVLLDAAGRIRPDAGVSSAPPALRDMAGKRAQSLLSATPLGQDQRRESGSFLTQLATQGALAAWPADLFNPVPGERREHRDIALPGGQQGRVEVSVKALGAQPGGLPQAVERTVTTVLAGTARTSREEWRLASADR